jgi:Leucine-rich repeat (LRR) protein
LTNVNLSKNDLRDISQIQHFSHLLNLQASTNQVSSIMFMQTEVGCLQFL